MAKYLVIVESPAKSKTIENYLGSDYIVMSSIGHIRDLATSGKDGLGIDFENGYAQKYVIISGKDKVVKQLKEAAKKVEKVFLATDPDREGEAIAWHLIEVLGLSTADLNRVVFNEITKKAVLQAMEHPKKIDMDMVHSQQTRRMLDRIIGFKLSKVLQRKNIGDSAGRVQSVAVRLVVDREREIEAFIPEEYHTIHATFSNLETELMKIDGAKAEVKSEEAAQSIINELKNDYEVVQIKVSDRERSSKIPFTTSTLQQESINKLGMSSSRTMKTAQTLYEGVNIGADTVGLITYMRTDSSRLAADFVKEAFKYIKSEFGDKYLGAYKGSTGAQDAHEGIRVTDIERTPEMLSKYLNRDQAKLYKLIYLRTIASLMAPAIMESTKITLANGKYTFNATSQKVKFDGYLKVYKQFEDVEETKLPKLTMGQVLSNPKVEDKQHFTKPKPRYTEASLIKEMEENGIGRPATYAQTMDNIEDRGYVEVQDKKFVPTKKGLLKADFIEQYFGRVIDVSFTKEMEEHLDKIAEAKESGDDTINRFFNLLDPLIEKANEEAEKVAAEETGELCPKCGHPLVVRSGKFGEFIACSNFPKCKFVKDTSGEEKPAAVVTDIVCPECKKGHLIERTATKGKNKGNKFYGCSNYPKCKYVTTDVSSLK